MACHVSSMAFCALASASAPAGWGAQPVSSRNVAHPRATAIASRCLTLGMRDLRARFLPQPGARSNRSRLAAQAVLANEPLQGLAVHLGNRRSRVQVPIGHAQELLQVLALTLLARRPQRHPLGQRL